MTNPDDVSAMVYAGLVAARYAEREKHRTAGDSHSASENLQLESLARLAMHAGDIFATALVKHAEETQWRRAALGRTPNAAKGDDL